MADPDPSMTLGISIWSQVSLRQAANVMVLNDIVKQFKLQIISLADLEVGIRVCAKTPMWRNFQSNWRRLYQRLVAGDLCPACLNDVTSDHDICPKCGKTLICATQMLRNNVPAVTVMKVGGWKDLKTMMKYIRLAGIEIENATQALSFAPEAPTKNQVVNLFQGSSILPKSE